MKLALLADVHGNLEALDAVLADMAGHAPDAAVVCAGDVVGYGPDPEACLARLAEARALVVRGNHEEMVLGERDFAGCVHAGIVGAVWTRERLAGSTAVALRALPSWAEAAPGVIVCHGDLADAGTYVSSTAAATRAIAQMRELRSGARLLVCGHTHHAAFFTPRRGLARIPPAARLALPEDEPCLVNPGAVGQARDPRPLARWALLDLERNVVAYRALDYDHETTIRKLRRAGLPARVTLPPPRGLNARIERWKASVARKWAQTRRPPPVSFSPPLLRRTLSQAAQRVVHAGRSAAGRAPAAPGAMILLYHAVVDTHDAPWIDPRFAVSAAAFDQQMGFLARERRVLGLPELLDMLDRGASPPAGSVLVSFDDGYRNTLETAAPILARHGVPAIVYLATGYVGRGEAQFIDTLYTAFNHRTRHVLDLSREGLPAAMLRDPHTVRRAYVAIDHRLITASVEDRTRILAELWGQLRPAVEPPRLTLNWDDVARMRRSYGAIALGVHTRSHLDLTACAPEVAIREIRASIDDLRREIGETAGDFSFPFGRSNETTRAAARQVGLRSAVVTDPPALVRPSTTRLALPRLSAPAGMSSFPFLTSGGYPLRSPVRT